MIFVLEVESYESGLGNLLTKKQADGQGFYSAPLNLDRFFWTVLFYVRISDKE
jgi:hypothetical protein